MKIVQLIWILWATASTAIYVAIAFRPGWFAIHIGSFGIVFLAISSWIIWIGLWRRATVFAAGAKRVPIWLRGAVRWSWLLLILWFLSGLSQNGHALRTNSPNPEEFADRTDGINTEDAINMWADLNRNQNGQAALVLVASSGGGIRAAYWTALVLSKLNEIPEFRQHLFAISSVSGGSLGASLFRASLTSASRHGGRCLGQALLACYKAFLSNDWSRRWVGRN